MTGSDKIYPSDLSETSAGVALLAVPDPTRFLDRFWDRFLVDFGSILGAFWDPFRSPRGLRSAPRPSRTAPRPPEIAPRPPQDRPRPPQDRPRPPQDRPKTTQDRPRPPQDRPRSLQDQAFIEKGVEKGIEEVSKPGNSQLLGYD